MKNIMLVLFLVMSAQVKADFSAKDVDPSLVLVSHGFNYRILVYSVCSPEHCWNETYLQSVSFGSENPEILCSTKIEEIEFGYVVTDVDWKGTRKAAEVLLSAQSSHGSFEPRVIEVSPTTNCSYTIKGASETGF